MKGLLSILLLLSLCLPAFAAPELPDWMTAPSLVPYVGQSVEYRPRILEDTVRWTRQGEEPLQWESGKILRATVTGLNKDGTVNVSVLDIHGKRHVRQRVRVLTEFGILFGDGGSGVMPAPETYFVSAPCRGGGCRASAVQKGPVQKAIRNRSVRGFLGRLRKH